MNRRTWIAVSAWTAAAALAVPVIFTGCGSATSGAGAVPTLPATAAHGGHGASTTPGSTAVPTGPEHTPGMVMPDGSTMTAPATGSAGSAGSAASAASTVGAEPSRTSTMVCDGDVKASVQELAAMATPPTTTTSWSDGLFTCTYALPQGALVLRVKESGTPAAAKAYFDGLQAGATDPVALEGLESLELPAFRSPVGIVSFVRDDKTLVVDARGLPASVGPQKTERTSFAYSVATNVLSCWKEHGGS